MTTRESAGRPDRSHTRDLRVCRVGLFGLLGSGNIGNDASMESVLSYLRTDHPNAVVDAMCMGPERVKAKYGIDAISLNWSRQYDQGTSRVTTVVLRALGSGVDAFRTAAWVWRHDVVIVPGMGVLEASLPLRPWGVPYSMFLLCASGKLFRTKVALVSVGANKINQRMTRWLFNSAARLAFYRSYRDIQSRDAMREGGIDTSRDPVYPDLVFGIPVLAYPPGDAEVVGVGVMSYYGSNDDRGQADEIYADYVKNVETFIRWLVDRGRKVRIFWGDACDESAVSEILSDLQEYRPDLGPGRVVAQPVSTFMELTEAMAPVGAVVATRYHNVMCALKLGKPTISIGYAKKNIALMANMGLPEFYQFAYSLDVDKLKEQFMKLESNSAQLRLVIAERNAENARRLVDQFNELSMLLFSAEAAHCALPGHRQ